MGTSNYSDQFKRTATRLPLSLSFSRRIACRQRAQACGADFASNADC